ncbi:uncharacterized protein LOC126760605 [Bactrocera neohumeralis]|uniref:uncharacterized protein LOC126760605 n=1 Tax=Bactrocera neohumeralis TaxID=98809 RepID=UPI00216502B9|nr:uncharacterized protein LOC126760605 [Bactrocera neohumeralis]XP_050332321.1 uncharacterized protein LOC126760605 [Bactrocera neohumeralis]XP_050332322.1 uncharacterized protein LOC126760605 [Bactrocera neohumeralis]XP_050332323.1 uncharacterized protein LOC126760605 [Bactrocera neohumeralis]XP_050332324.1 uncharacterized protein LOC126760605 [Bactrocera neohumeralis]XP_050332325.1 uncharacterized protein LOC126760605 [Bactrocera neohumeralis]
MVSTTTTTTIAAGQPTSSSNHHSHHQQQQQQQQQQSAAAATLGSTTANTTATANNSNYQRSTSQQQNQQQHQQQQQHTQSYYHPSSSAAQHSYYNSLALNGVGGNSNNNNNTSNSSRHNNSKSRVTTKTASALSTGGNVTGQESVVVVGDHNTTHQQTRPSPTSYNGGGSGNAIDDSQPSSNSSSATPTTTTTVTATTTNKLTRTLEEETASVEPQPQSHETTSDTKSPTATTTTAATVNLSQALLSSSPPLLNDQISLLFPKCRPRQLSPNGSQPTVSRNSSIPSKSQSQEHSATYKQRVSTTFDRDIVYGESVESTRAASQPPPQAPVNYYKSVNIITQSPPPPSTSSVSSESLSSVTPRISTNPFLSHNDSVEDKPLTRATRTQHKFADEDKSNASGRRTRNDKRHEGHYSDVVDDDDILNDSAHIEDEELPVPSYPPTFYYHTETKHSQGPTRQRHHQTGDNSNSYEMPRKRASYGSHHHPSQQSYGHFVNSSTQQQLQHKQSNNHNGANAAAGNLNQNPFIKDGNYWDTVRHGNTSEVLTDNADTRLPSHYNELADAEEQHVMGTPMGTQSSDFGSTASTSGPIATAAHMSSVRRSYHQQQQQPYTNSSYNMSTRQHHQQQHQQQQHISRLGRNTMEAPAGEQFAETTTKRGYHAKQQQMQRQQQQQQHNSLQAVQDSCAEGLTPLASHYLYGSKTSLDQQQHVISVSDNSILVEREIRERDREQREQRKVAAAYGEWEREREREREWERERDREREQRGREKEKGREREKEREYEREQVRCRDPYPVGPQHYQAVKHRNSMKNSNLGDTNGHNNVTNNGEMVVFDDITESWQNLRVTTDTSAPTISPASTRQQLQQQQHHRQPTSLTLVDDNKDDYAEEDLNEQHGVVEVTGSHNTSNNNTSIMYKDHPKRYLDRSSYTMRAVETRHGIIEYEGSPRRIGGQAVVVVPAGIEDEAEAPSAAEEEVEADAAVSNAQQTHSQQQLTKTATTTNASNNGGGGGGGNSQHTNATTTTHNSPQQQYPARPGFPQRIISPPRESTPPIVLLSHSNSKHQQQQQQQDYQQPQTLPQRQSSPPTTCTLDNNAEDTSNDVSEIGTISDLTTPEAISTSGIPTTPTFTIESPAVNASNTTTMPPSASNAACKPLTAIGSSAFSIPTKSSTFDYLYEFSETRKVLEEFFKCPSMDDRPIENGSDVDSVDIQYEFHSNLDHGDDDELDSPSNVNIDGDEDEDDEDEEDDDDDDDDGLMGVDMDGIQPQQHHHQLQQQHNNQMRQLQTTIQQRNNQRETQIHLQTSPTPTLYRQQQSQQQQQQQQQQQYLQQQPSQPLQTPQDSRQRKTHSQRQQQQLNNSSNNSNSNSNNYNNSTNAHRRRFTASPLMRDFDFFLDSASRSSGEQLDQQDGVNHNQLDTPGTYRYSPETTDYDSNCGDLDSLSGEINGVSTSCSNYTKYYASSMPVLEDGLSSGHTSDTENQNNLNNNLQQPSAAIHHNPIGSGGISMLMDMKRLSTNNSINSMNNLTISTTDGGGGGVGGEPRNNSISSNIMHDTTYLHKNDSPTSALGMHEDSGRESVRSSTKRDGRERELLGQSPTSNSNNKVFKNIDPELDSLYSISIFHRPDMVQMTPPPPAPAPHRKPNILSPEPEILQPTPYKDNNSHGAPPPSTTSPINALGTALGSNSGSGVTSVASAISSTLNRNKLHSAQHQSGSSNAPSVLSNALRATNQSHTQTQLLPTTQTLSSTQSQSQSQSQTQSQPPPPPIPERSMPRTPSPVMNSPVWLPRHLDNSANKSLLASSPGHHSKNLSADEDDVDTDLETDRLLGHQRLDDQGYYDENKSWESRKPRSSLLSKISPKQMASTKTRNGYNALLSTMPEIPPPIPPKNSTSKLLDIDGSMSSSEHSDKSPLKSIDVQDCVVGMGSPGGSDGSACISANSKKELDLSTINSNGLANSGGSNSGSGSGSGSGTGSGGVGVGGGIGLLGTGNANGNVGGNVSGNGSGVGVGGGGSGGGGHSSSAGSNSTSGEKKVKKSKNKEGGAVLIEGVLFRAKYLGSTQLVCEGQPTKSTRMMQAEEAVSRIKAPDGDVQPSTEVDLFISTEKIMVLNTDLKEIMMDHALRTISYIADIGDLVVLMARRRFVPQDIDDAPKPNRTPKMICHVFESDEAQFIAQSIGQAFQVAYMEFLKANGIEDHSFVKEMDYQEVLNSQEIFGDELEIFAKKELQKEVVVPKAKGEILGVVIVESGWGSMLPTVVIANLMSSGAAARCGQLNIGDQLIAINGLSLVGLPLSTCQTYIKNTKNQTVVKFTVVPCAPVVEVKIKRPNTKYQLGFSVQNGVICSLLRGGIAERGGVRVGHRIIEINNQSVVAVPHEKIVNLLATSVGEILMKTMPTSMFRLLTGQENPIYI